MGGTSDGQLYETFQPIGVIIGSELKPHSRLESLSICGEERALIPAAGCCEGSGFQSIIINRK